MSPRPATAPSGDSRQSKIAQHGDTNFEQWSTPRGERPGTHSTATYIPPATTSDEHRTTITQGTPSEVTQSEGHANRQLGNAATSHSPLSAPDDDPWRRKTLLTLGTFASRIFSVLI